MSKDLLLHQEVLLLALADDKGVLTGGMVGYALAGAMLSELLLQERIVANDDKQRIVAVVNDKPVGEPMLDELLAMIGESKKNRGMQEWVVKAAGMKDLHHRIAMPLCQMGILKQDERKILFLFTQKIYPEINGSWEDAIRQRMAAVMFHEDQLPDDRTAVLIALASQTGILSQNFAPVELKQHRERIEKLAKGEILAADATAAAIEAVQAAITVAIIASTVAATTAASVANS